MMHRNKLMAIALLAAAATARSEGLDELKLTYHGAGWLQGGRVEASEGNPSAGNNYNKNWLGNAGGLLTINSRIDEGWDAQLGLGTVLVHLARGNRGISNKWYPFWVSFVDEARITRNWNLGSEGHGLALTLGNFHHGYNPDVKNFGLYLNHGYVYPGAIVSGFTGPLGVHQTISGAMLGYKNGGFNNEFIVQIETDDKPLYDISVSDIATWKIASGLEIAGGINLYRLFAAKEKATNPGKDCDPNYLGPYAGSATATESPCYIIKLDAAGNPTDTVLASLAGVKLMGRFSLDPMALIGSESEVLGKGAFSIYSEFAVLGVQNYPRYYDKIGERIPIMFGINLPGFNFMNWSVEVEHYGSKNSSNNLAARNGSPIPGIETEVDTKRDNLKYSVNASKVVAGNFILLGQVANDHLRLGGNHDEDTGKEAMRVPTDWYWTTKIAYFF